MPEQFAFDADDDRMARAAWSRIAEPRDQDAARLIRALGAAEALHWLARAATNWCDPPGLSAGPRLRAGLRRWAPRLENLDPRRELEMLARCGGHLLVPSDPQWPQALAELGDDAPPCLWVRGDPAVWERQCVALIGARACSSYGQEVAGGLAQHLSAEGITVISGGAFGIDAAAHRATLAAHGTPVAVMAGGVDRLYPVANSPMLEQVCHTGAVISEVPPASSPMRHRFLSRNRLIAALAAVTVVVEAGWRSGALNTANHAIEMGRDVAAVPGPVTSPHSAGCHRLLREGAVCVTDGPEVLQLCTPLGEVDDGSTARGHVPGLLDGLDPAQARVLESLPARGSAELAGVVRSSGLGQTEVQAALGFLELGGKVQQMGARWRRA